MVLGISDVEKTSGHGDALGLIEQGFEGRAAIPRVAWLASAGDRDNDAGSYSHLVTLRQAQGERGCFRRSY